MYENSTIMKRANDLMDICIYRNHVDDQVKHLKLVLSRYEDNIIEYTMNIMDMYINDYPLHFAEENFEELMEQSVSSILTEHLRLLYHRTLNISSPIIGPHQHIHSDSYYELCMEYMDICYPLFYETIIPRRSYKHTFIRKKPSIKLMDKKITEITNLPQPEQRTNEWYEFRHNLITASSAGKIFDRESSRNQLIYEKCGPIKNFSGGNNNNNINLDSPLHWGQKYEPVSVEIYENEYNTKVGEFGCLPHLKYDFLGASPDGINVESNNDRYGRMLEIKNVVNRIITRIPKKLYWIQMQLQMETCNLNECDFLETKFIEYPTKEDFDNDGTFLENIDGKEKGIILRFSLDDGSVKYEYKPLNMIYNNYLIWKNEKIEKYGCDKLMEVIYWKLEIKSCILVLRNKLWFKSAIVKIEETWNIIEKERIEGCEHRAPKKKINKSENMFNECLINMDIDGNILHDNTNIEVSNNTENKTDNETIEKFFNPEKKIRTESFDETLIKINKGELD
tara:strand:- start:11537 stop:13060 length:1524 start_codon:yes stop_codon:yes gene_type:complete